MIDRNPDSSEMPGLKETQRQRTFRSGKRAMLVALVVGVIITGSKFAAYWITESAAILSDALESIINVVASSFALASLTVSARPPDESHPYGHGKIEYFSAGFEGALIILAAGGIFFHGVRQIVAPHPLPSLTWGLLILTVVSFANLALGVTLLRMGKRGKSIVLEADGRHLLTDVYTSAGVVAGLVLVHFSGWNRLDGIVACTVGAHIVLSGLPLVRGAFGGLMDESDPVLLEEICSVLRKHRQDLWIDIHRLRAKRAGSHIQLDFHLILPRDLPLEEAHKEVKNLERAFGEHFSEQVDVLIHLDPCADPDCSECANGTCNIRQQESVGTRPWRKERLISE